MAQDDLSTYLNDHLAGSVGALELLEDLINACTEPLRREEMRALKQEITDDQDLVKKLLGSLPSEESAVKKAGAWVAQKLSRAKLKLTDPGSDALGEVEAFEILSLGIEGKKGLWKVLADMPAYAVPNTDWAELQRNAGSQRARVELWRLEAARRAFHD